MSDPQLPDDAPGDLPAASGEVDGRTPPASDAAPSGFADYSAYEAPNVVAPPPAASPDQQPPARQGRGPLPLIAAVVVIAAAAIGAFVVFSGGSGSDESDASSPGDAVVAWATRMADEDYAGACELMAAGSVAAIESNGPTCAAALAALDPDGLYGRADGAEVVAEDVDGATAQITISGGGAAMDGKVILVERADGVWKASPFVGAAGASGTETEPTAPPNPDSDTDGASAAACEVSIATTETAAAAYETVNGEPAADVQALVDGGFLRDLPPNVAIGPDGTVSGTGPCA